MKIRLCSKYLSIGFWLLTITSVTQATNNSNPQRFKVLPSPVFQSIRNQSLTETLKQIAQRSGIIFKIDTDLSQDRVEQSVAAANWQEAIQKILLNHNYSTIEDQGKIKSVIISGHKNDGIDNQPTVNGKSDEHMMILKRNQYQLPDRYKRLPEGSVMPVKLPINTIINTPKNKDIEIDLPVGRFNVTHDNTVDEPDGSKTWIGHLADEGEAYRVFLSQGAAGLMGFITTPDTKFRFESDQDGSTFLLDTSQLKHGEFNGDTKTHQN